MCTLVEGIERPLTEKNNSENGEEKEIIARFGVSEVSEFCCKNQAEFFFNCNHTYNFDFFDRYYHRRNQVYTSAEMSFNYQDKSITTTFFAFSEVSITSCRKQKRIFFKILKKLCRFNSDFHGKKTNLQLRRKIGFIILIS